MKKSELGRRLWGTIEVLGVVSEKDPTRNKMMLEALERHDMVGLEVLKENVSV